MKWKLYIDDDEFTVYRLYENDKFTKIFFNDSGFTSTLDMLHTFSVYCDGDIDYCPTGSRTWNPLRVDDHGVNIKHQLIKLDTKLYLKWIRFVNILSKSPSISSMYKDENLDTPKYIECLEKQLKLFGVNFVR